MNNKTLRALDASIEHWEKNANAASPSDVSVKADDCALCNLFLHKKCAGCPVAQASGINLCLNTPFEFAADEWRRWKWDEPRGDKYFRIFALAELSFLKAIRPIM